MRFLLPALARVRGRRCAALLAGASAVLAAASAARGECRYAWSAVGGGVSGRVTTLLSVEGGTGSFEGPGAGALYVGGLFAQAGGAPMSNIARWDGSAWTALQSGVGAEAQCMAIFDDGMGAGPALYVGGEFTVVSGQPISYIARWDGSTWSQVGMGINDHVLALIVHDDGLGAGPALYAGGFFPNAGNGFFTNRIAKWDGAQWSPLGAGMNSFVRALAVFDDGLGGGERLIAAGQFTTAGGLAANRIASWDGVGWSALGDGVDNVIYALAVFDSGSGAELYVGGSFTSAGGQPIARIARWDGAQWSAVGSGVNNDVTTLRVLTGIAPGGPALYAGGLFTAAGGAGAARVARWNGSTWSGVGAGVGPSFVYALASQDWGDGARLCAGGDFAVTGAGATATGIASAQLVGADGDANGDLVVNFEDVTEILALWGVSYPGGTGPGDADGDGAVNMADLTSTITHWLADCRLDR